MSQVVLHVRRTLILCSARGAHSLLASCGRRLIFCRRIERVDFDPIDLWRTG